MIKKSFIVILFILSLPSQIYGQALISPGIPQNSFTLATVTPSTGTFYALPQSSSLTITWTITYSGAPASITVLLEGSLDNSNWFTIDTSTNTSGEGRTVSPLAWRFIRARISASSGGTGITVSINVLRFSPNLVNPVSITNGGTGSSLSDPNADRIFFWDDSAGSTQFLTLGTNLSITDTTLNAAGGTTGVAFVICSAEGNPADASTFYVGPNCFFPFTGGNTDPNYFYAPITGTITSIRGNINVRGTLGTTEQFTLSIRVDETTDTTIVSNATADAFNVAFSNTSMSAAVTAGQRIRLKMVTPTWVTNPTVVRITMTVFIQGS